MSERPPSPLKSFTTQWLAPAALTLAALLPLRSAVADWHDVPTGSMWPTVVEGDRVFVDKLAYGLRVPFTHTWLAHWDAPARGDIVTCASPEDGARLLKRVVGLPGDRIEIRKNVLYVNGESVEMGPFDEGYVGKRLPDGREVSMRVADEALPTGRGGRRSHRVAFTQHVMGLRPYFAATIVPAGHYFMLGDNRDQSKDSRIIGSVPREHVYGRATWVPLSVDWNTWRPRFERWGSALQ
jgi:signal peptidase I